jgi:hypothetical protein
MPRISAREYGNAYLICFDCGAKYRGNKFHSVGRCPECRATLSAQFLIYDRDKGVGALPSNLRGK